MSNPYAAPDADISLPGDDGEYQPKLFSFNGRIGRLRYIGWGFLFTLIAYIPMVIIGVILGASMEGLEDPGSNLALIISIPIFVFMLAASFVVSRRRLHDLNRSAWFFLLFFIPLINIAISLYLLFWPGTVGSNRFGLQPAKNDKTIWIVLAVAIVVSLGLFAGVAIPAYQGFLEASGS